MARIWDDKAVKWVVDKLKELTNKSYLARQTLSTGNTNLPLLMSGKANTAGTASVDDISYRNNVIYANPSTGKITAKGYTINGKAEIQYDDTNKCINFVFN